MMPDAWGFDSVKGALIAQCLTVISEQELGQDSFSLITDDPFGPSLIRKSVY